MINDEEKQKQNLIGQAKMERRVDKAKEYEIIEGDVKPVENL